MSEQNGEVIFSPLGKKTWETLQWPFVAGPLVIAECGNNHEGDIDVALELLERAREAGADFCKFQAGTAEGFARRPEDVPRYKKYELGRYGYDRLLTHGKKIGMPVFFSVWSEEFAAYRSLQFFKLAARQCTAENIAKYAGANTFISVPHDLSATEVLALGISRGVALHCVSEYPSDHLYPERFFDLRAILPPWVPIGYSDHHVGIAQATRAARSYGAYVIEKHFTLKHDFGPLRDHALSADPAEFRQLVETVKGG